MEVVAEIAGVHACSRQRCASERRDPRRIGAGGVRPSLERPEIDAPRIVARGLSIPSGAASAAWNRRAPSRAAIAHTIAITIAATASRAGSWMVSGPSANNASAPAAAPAGQPTPRSNTFHRARAPGGNADSASSCDVREVASRSTWSAVRVPAIPMKPGAAANPAYDAITIAGWIAAVNGRLRVTSRRGTAAICSTNKIALVPP